MSMVLASRLHRESLRAERFSYAWSGSFQPLTVDAITRPNQKSGRAATNQIAATG